jgi:predicted protein tyrosine phosphatase
MNNPFIQNVSLDAVRKGNHKDAGDNSILIQIVDPAYEFPTPSFDFKEVHQFEFLDAEGTEGFPDEVLITDDQAEKIINILHHALKEKLNVIVHCHAGIARSGAVAEVGVMMGFYDTRTHRIPNLLVKGKLLRKLGWYYDPIDMALISHS